MSKMYCKNCENVIEIEAIILDNMESNEFIDCDICGHIMGVMEEKSFPNNTMADSMVENIEYFGIIGTFKRIDEMYKDAIIRYKIRIIFFEELRKRNLSFDGYKMEDNKN